MTRQRDEQYYEKRVDYVAKDEEAQTATGVVMTPFKVDRQGDWERPETIETFAAQFEAFMDVDEADGGVMHAVWPSEWMSLERNEVLEESAEIGGKTVDAGAWVQTWGYNDDGLWSLVEDDILGGHSIGAVNVDWTYNGTEPEDLPEEVSVPDDVDVEEYYELTDGIIQEVSAVDIPAVPDAQILSTSKAQAATAEKRLADHLGNRDGFIEEAAERGHSEEDAQRLWDVLDRGVNVEGASEPGAKSKLTSAATAFLNALTGSNDGTTASTSEAPDASTAKDAPGGETPDDDGGTEAAADMTNEDNPMEDAPKWAQALHDDIKENSERIENALEADENGDKNAGAEGGDGEGADKNADDPMDDAPEWAKALKAETEKNAQRIDDVAKASGASQQIDGAGASRGNRKYSSDWDQTFGLPGGDA
jgi:hypothetical protein